MSLKLEELVGKPITEQQFDDKGKKDLLPQGQLVTM